MAKHRAGRTAPGGGAAKTRKGRIGDDESVRNRWMNRRPGAYEQLPMLSLSIGSQPEPSQTHRELIVSSQ